MHEPCSQREQKLRFFPEALHWVLVEKEIPPPWCQSFTQYTQWYTHTHDCIDNKMIGGGSCWQWPISTCNDADVYLFYPSSSQHLLPVCLYHYIHHLRLTPPGIFPSLSHVTSLTLPVSLCLSSFLPALFHPVAPGCYFSDLSPVVSQFSVSLRFKAVLLTTQTKAFDTKVNANAARINNYDTVMLGQIIIIQWWLIQCLCLSPLIWWIWCILWYSRMNHCYTGWPQKNPQAALFDQSA